MYVQIIIIHIYRVQSDTIFLIQWEMTQPAKPSITLTIWHLSWWEHLESTLPATLKCAVLNYILHAV
jgi:hypothetical protein